MASGNGAVKSAFHRVRRAYVRRPIMRSRAAGRADPLLSACACDGASHLPCGEGAAAIGEVMYQGAVAFLVAQDYADAEFRLPYDRVGRLDTFDVVVIGLEAGVRVRGRERTEAVEIEQSISDVHPEDFVGLVIPGGGSPDHLLADPRAVPWVSRFSATGHTLAAAAEGSAVLAATGLARGRSIAAWPVNAQRLASLGVCAVDEPVVRDGAWLTSRHLGDTDALVLALLQSLRHDEPASFEERHSEEHAP